MEKENLIEWIKHPEKLDQTSLPLLEKLVRDHPYFQVGLILLTRNLKNLNDTRYEAFLQRTAASIPDRNSFLKFLLKNPATPPRRSFSRKVDAIIERFLKDEHKIKPVKVKNQEDIEIIDKSLDENDAITSETLARLYFDQGNPTRAIEIYERLCLLFPEKSSYFAGQIEKIRNSSHSNT